MERESLSFFDVEYVKRTIHEADWNSEEGTTLVNYLRAWQDVEEFGLKHFVDLFCEHVKKEVKHELKAEEVKMERRMLCQKLDAAVNMSPKLEARTRWPVMEQGHLRFLVNGGYVCVWCFVCAAGG